MAATLPTFFDYYPPSPADVPESLTKPTFRYRLQSLLVTASLFVFVLVYFSLIAFFALVSLMAFSELADLSNFDGMSTGRATSGIMFVAFVGIMFGLVALYFIKGLFKTPKLDDSRYFQVTEDDQPELFAFIDQICVETGAPRPAKIVLSEEVNASVYYNCSFWRLFFPARKNLHIGLGLVNCLTLAEFKAVMAHEFGHFSQRSMRLGAYVYTANRVIQEVIYGRDWLDDSLAIFRPVLAVVRWVLGGIYKVLNFTQVQLSRQMEFHADLVAVSVTGSDAVVHGLLRSDFAQQCYDQTMSDLTAAGDHNLFTNDLFHHQTKSADFLRALKNEPTLGVPPQLPEDETETTEVFPPNDTTLPPMWSTHPQHYQREANCKRVYIRSPLDDRPAWVLFRNQHPLRQQMTQRFYERVRPNVTVQAKSAEAIQRFIDADRAEMVYATRYDGMYQDGLISPGAIDAIERYIPQRTEHPASLLAEHESIFSPDLRAHLKEYTERREDQRRLLRFANKIERPVGGRFLFRGKSYRVGKATKLLKQLDEELKADCVYLAGLDCRVFLVYMGMARQLRHTTAQELEQRYRFHLAVQKMISTLRYWDGQLQYSFAGVAGKRNPAASAVQGVVHALTQTMNAIDDQVTAAGVLRMPAFSNMKAGQTLAVFLDPKPVIRGIVGTAQILDGSWINQTLARNAEMIDKLRRVLFKSLGSLLAFQEKIGEEYKARFTNPDAAPPVPAVTKESLAKRWAMAKK